jgi:hypothetical protein
MLGGSQILARNPSTWDKIKSALGQTFGGVDDPNLSPEQNAAARRQALLQGGIAALLASRGQQRPGLAAVIAQGAATGQQVGGMARLDIAQQNALQAQAQRKAQLAQLIRSGMPPEQLIRELLAQGDSQGANAVIGMMNASRPEKPAGFMSVGDGVVFDPNSKTFIRDPNAKPDVGKPSTAVHEGMNNGKPELFRFGADGKPEWLGIAPPPKPTGGGTGRQEEAADFTQTMGLKNGFRAETTNASKVATQLKRARVAGKGAIGDQTLIAALQSMVDPLGSIREGDVQRLGGAGGLSEKAQFYYNRIGKKGELPTEIRRQLVDEIEAIADEEREGVNGTLEQYRELAKQFKLDPDRLFSDPFKGLDSRRPAPTAPAQIPPNIAAIVTEIRAAHPQWTTDQITAELQRRGVKVTK